MLETSTQDGFDLEITTIEAAPRTGDLLNSTSDGCGYTPDTVGVACDL